MIGKNNRSRQGEILGLRLRQFALIATCRLINPQTQVSFGASGPVRVPRPLAGHAPAFTPSSLFPMLSITANALRPKYFPALRPLALLYVRLDFGGHAAFSTGMCWNDSLPRFLALPRPHC